MYTQVARLRADLDFMTALSAETQGGLEAKLEAVRTELRQRVERMAEEQRAERAASRTETLSLQGALEHMTREKEASEGQLRELLRRNRAEWDEEEQRLRGRLHRLTSAQHKAMEAGSFKAARQVLYWEHIKGEEAEPTLTWRSSDAHLPRSPPTAQQRGRFSHREEEEADWARLVPSAAESPF